MLCRCIPSLCECASHEHVAIGKPQQFFHLSIGAAAHGCPWNVRWVSGLYPGQFVFCEAMRACPFVHIVAMHVVDISEVHFTRNALGELAITALDDQLPNSTGGTNLIDEDRVAFWKDVVLWEQSSIGV